MHGAAVGTLRPLAAVGAVNFFLVSFDKFLESFAAFGATVL